jgi:hypothetical protein
MKPRDNGSENFTMLFNEEFNAAVLGAVRQRLLLPRDVLVLMGVVTNMNWRSGRARITPKALAAQVGMQDTHTYLSLKRLQQQQFLARVCDPHTGEVYFLINPRLASVGSPQRRGHLFQQFDEALE